MKFAKTIISWYHKNKRDLPWRDIKDPYKIWLSEIILQQTRVQQGLPYYKQFAKKFPTVHHLAKANEDVVLKTWQGLGYYSRARNLHQTAKVISENGNGRFPDEYDDILKLKGIGSYTAAAIASFAFNKPYPVVDGNVFRVLSRYLGIRTPIDSSKGKSEFLQNARLLLDKKNPGIFNQAIMEFGALQCVPQNPDCRICPLKRTCKAFARNEVSMFPVKAASRQKIRKRYFNYLVIKKNTKVLIQKRTKNDIWKNLYEFPMIETKKEVSSAYIKKMLDINPKSLPDRQAGLILNPKSIKHILSHQIIYARFWEVFSKGNPDTYLKERKKYFTENKNKNYFYVTDNQINRYPFPRLIEKYFQAKKEQIRQKNINFSIY